MASAYAAICFFAQLRRHPLARRAPLLAFAHEQPISERCAQVPRHLVLDEARVALDEDLFNELGVADHDLFYRTERQLDHVTVLPRAVCDEGQRVGGELVQHPCKPGAFGAQLHLLQLKFHPV
jgi:hypothetical protein